MSGGAGFTNEKCVVCSIGRKRANDVFLRGLRRIPIDRSGVRSLLSRIYQTDPARAIHAIRATAAIRDFRRRLIGTGFSVLADPPPGDDFRSGFIAIALIAAAFYFGMIVPLKANITYESRSKLLISVRIDRLKNEEWTSDSKADVLETIEQDRAAIKKLSNDLNPIFFVLLAFLIASDADWLIFYHKVHAPTISVEALVMAIAVSGIVAQYWAWPKALRIKLAELGSYRDQAEKLALPIPVNAAMIDHRRNHDLWVAAGGLIVGVILARAGGVLHRNRH